MNNEPKPQASFPPEGQGPNTPPLCTPNSKLRTSPSRPRSSIARLPHTVREMLNVALREGEPYPIISARIAKLVGNKHPCITPAMFSRWLRTGYRDWLQQQTHLENTLAQTDAALTRLNRLHQQTGASLPDLTDTLLLTILQTILQDFDPASIKALLAEKPAEFFRLVSCLNAHIAARSRDKNAEVARARCQVELAEKAQTSRPTPVAANEIWEKQLVLNSFGGPVERAARAFKVPYPSRDFPTKPPPIPEKSSPAGHKPRSTRPRAIVQRPPSEPSPEVVPTPIVAAPPPDGIPTPCVDPSPPNPTPPSLT